MDHVILVADDDEDNSSRLRCASRLASPSNSNESAIAAHDATACKLFAVIFARSRLGHSTTKSDVSCSNTSRDRWRT